MSSIPEYLTGNAFLALEEARDNASHVLATRRALIRYRMSLSDSVAHKASGFIANEIHRFGHGIGLPDSWQEAIVARAKIYFQADEYSIPPLTLTRFMGLEGNPTRPSKPILALTRDFLIAKGFLHADDLNVQHAHLLSAYELQRVFKPSGPSVFAGLVAKRAGEWLFAQFEPKHIAIMTLLRFSPGLYDVQFVKMPTRSIKRCRVLQSQGWLFLAGDVRGGAIQAADDPDAPERTITLKGISEDHIILKFCKSTSEIEEDLDGDSYKKLEVLESYEKFEKIEKIQYTSSYSRKRNLPGGARFSTASKTQNTDLGGPLDDKKKMGEELLEQYAVSLENDLIDDEVADAAMDRVCELIEAGADLNIASPRLKNMTAMHVIARHHMFWAMDLAFARDDVDYLAQTDDERYPFDFLQPTTIPYEGNQLVPQYSTELFKRALEQGKPNGITREQLLKLSADAPPLPPPLPPPGGFDDGPG